jgi:hypothetical protein
MKILDQTSKHTPGPWHVTYPSPGLFKLPFVSDENGHPLAEVGHVDSLPEKNLANAVLMAALPDLLAALEKAQAAIYETINHRPVNLSHAWHDCQNAIAKAKGDL